jgi:hypothetical protein
MRLKCENDADNKMAKKEKKEKQHIVINLTRRPDMCLYLPFAYSIAVLLMFANYSFSAISAFSFSYPSSSLSIHGHRMIERSSLMRRFLEHLCISSSTMMSFSYISVSLSLSVSHAHTHTRARARTGTSIDICIHRYSLNQHIESNGSSVN